jgi:septal ring factor EnvC (AmiA/AmiB activator)
MENTKSSISKIDESLQPLHEDIKSILKSINEIKEQIILNAQQNNINFDIESPIIFSDS